MRIGSFGFGDPEDVFSSKEAISYLKYINKWAKNTCNGARSALQVMLFNFPDERDAEDFKELLSARFIKGDIDKDVVISADKVYVVLSDPCSFEIDIFP